MRLGGVIQELAKYAKQLCGVEIGEQENKYLHEKGIRVCKSIDDYPAEMFDIITLFHVVEHLADPVKTLAGFKKHLKKGGYLIMETPNAEDALLELYRCERFADFTYWSPHVFLYNRETFQMLAEQCQYKVIFTKQVQRYPLSNHLYWLAEGKPGGHEKWGFLNDADMDGRYAQRLAGLGMCDTLLTVWKYEV